MAQSIITAPASVWISKFKNLTLNNPNQFSKSTQFNFLNGQIVSNQVDFSGVVKIEDFVSDENSDLFNVSISLDQLKVQANDLQLHIQIQQELGFGSATLNFDAICPSVVVKANQPQKASFSLDHNFEVKKVFIDFSHVDISTNITGCDSISGLQQEIQQTILNTIRTQLFENEIKKIITAEIKNLISTQLNSIAQLFVESKNGLISTKLSLDSAKRLWIYVGENAETSFSSQEIQTLTQANSAAALLKKSSLEKSITANLNDLLKKNPIQSKTNSSLQRLTCSRFVQFFVWPALKAFPKCFDMTVISQIKEMKLVDLQSLSFNLKTESWSLEASQQRKIAYFLAQTAVSLNPSSVTIDSVKAQHDPDFLKWSGRSSRISTGMISTSLQQYLSEQLKKVTETNGVLNPKQIKSTQQIGADTLLVQLNGI